MSPIAYVALVLVLIALISWRKWRHHVLGRIDRWGKDINANGLAKRKADGQAVFAIGLEIDADIATATRLIDEAVTAKPKQATSRGEGIWTVRADKSDDVVAQLTTRPGGSSLGVTQVADYNDSLWGHQFWQVFMDRVAKAAQAAGVGVREVSGQQTFQRVSDPSGTSVWVPSA